jgi:zinc transport system substrate-binding protein
MPARFLLLLVVCAAAHSGCTPVSDGWTEGKSGPKIVVSFAPLYCFAVNVAGEDAEVRTVMTTQGPHGFNPSPTDSRMLSRADIFFSNGLLLDDGIAKRLVNGSGNTRLKHVALGAKLDASLILEGACNHNHDHGGGDAKHDHEHDHGQDPHIWLGMPQAAKLVEAIRDELKALDPAHAANYDRRATEYLAKLDRLKAEGQAMLAPKKNKRLVCFHESLNYLANTYDLTVSGVVEASPGHEPSSKELDTVVATCVKRTVRIIAVEPQYSAKTAAETILTELKRKGVPNPLIVTVDPLETCSESELTPDWYETRMRANFAALAGAFE